MNLADVVMNEFTQKLQDNKFEKDTINDEFGFNLNNKTIQGELEEYIVVLNSRIVKQFIEKI